MTFLPVVERELRVAARKRSTIWFRVLGALIALVIGAGFLLMSLAIGAGTSRLGNGLFETLTWLALGATLAAGLFFTADSLSEEKREGTLGFLFLTDLRGYDVVVGKLLATSLRGAYALLALFPVLAVTLLMGGVTGLQFCKSALALVNSLFCSLAAGLFVSACCRDPQRAMTGTFALLVLVCGGGPLIDSVLAVSRVVGSRPMLSLLSPVYVFWAASAWGRTAYWTGLAVSHLLGWVLFAMACLLVPRTWQDRGRGTRGPRGTFSYFWKYGGAAARGQKRSKLIDLNPVLWLASRERWRSIGIWVLVLLVLGPFIAIGITVRSMVWVLWGQISWLVLVLLYVGTAAQASRFVIEAKKSGLMELLLVTPLSSRDIAAGQWHALLRRFALPVVLLVLVQVGGTLILRGASPGMSASAGGPTLAMNLMTAVANGLCMVANLAALMWFGIWAGLTSKNSNMAALKTLVFVQVLPSIGIGFASTAIVGLFMFQRAFTTGAGSATMMLSFPLVMAGFSALLSIAKDAAFVIWARQRLYSTFRAEAARFLNAPNRPAATGGQALSPSPAAIRAQP